MTEFLPVPEFSKDLEKLNKRFRSLYEDLETFSTALEEVLPAHLPKTVQISGLGHEVKVPIFKVRRFRCRYLKRGSNSGLRIIYAYEQEGDKITLIELYYKGNQEIEDRKRILKYFS